MGKIIPFKNKLYRNRNILRMDIVVGKKEIVSFLN